jgi:hypothetical protein
MVAQQLISFLVLTPLSSITSQSIPRSRVQRSLLLANASSLLSIRVAADLEETIALLKSTVEKHEGVKLSIDVSLPAVVLDADVEGFNTIVVSYFTVSLPPSHPTLTAGLCPGSAPPLLYVTER